MKLLVSPRNIKEATECIACKVDIIDVKNPLEGSLGANFPWIIKAIRNATPKDIPISATVGDAPNKPGTIALAALGAANSGANYIKVGLYGPKTEKEAIKLMKAVTQTFVSIKADITIVAAGYAEGKKINCLEPQIIPEIAAKANCHFAMLDTYLKDNKKTLFDHLSMKELQRFINKSYNRGLKTALGGGIQIKHLTKIAKLNPDVIGIRGAVCQKGDRVQGEINRKLIQKFQKNFRKIINE